MSCPDLRGCHSQGETREEALANIRDATRLWLEAEAVWLQADAALWRAPRPAGLAAFP